MNLSVAFEFRLFRAYVNSLSGKADIDAFVHLGWENNAFGTTGIAYTGAVCASEIGVRTSLNEYFMSNLETAQVCYLQITLHKKHFRQASILNLGRSS